MECFTWSLLWHRCFHNTHSTYTCMHTTAMLWLTQFCASCFSPLYLQKRYHSRNNCFQCTYFIQNTKGGKCVHKCVYKCLHIDKFFFFFFFFHYPADRDSLYHIMAGTSKLIIPICCYYLEHWRCCSKQWQRMC